MTLTSNCPHVIDAFIYLTGQRVVEVNAHFVRGIHKVDIEDMVSVTMIGEEGAIGVGEAGYVMPEGYERYVSVTTDTLYIGSNGVSGEVLFCDGERLPVAGADGDEVYFRYTGDLLNCLETGEPPRATIGDMVPTLRVINAAHESARSGKPVRLDAIDD